MTKPISRVDRCVRHGSLLTLGIGLALTTTGPAAAAGLAQRGVIALRGSVGASHSVRAVRFVDHNGTRASLGSSTRIDFVGGAGTDPSRPLAGTLTLALRSNAPYALALTAEVEGVAPSEVAVGVAALRPSGLRTRAAASARSRITSGFAGDPRQRESPATLSSLIDRPTTVLVGPAISAGGRVDDPDNALLVDLTFAASARSSRSSPFSVRVLYTIGSP